MINEATSAVPCCYTAAARTAASAFTFVNMMQHLHFWTSICLHLANSMVKSNLYEPAVTFIHEILLYWTKFFIICMEQGESTIWPSTFMIVQRMTVLNSDPSSLVTITYSWLIHLAFSFNFLKAKIYIRTMVSDHLLYIYCIS